MRQYLFAGLLALSCGKDKDTAEQFTGLDIMVDGEEVHLPTLETTISIDGTEYGYAQASKITVDEVRDAIPATRLLEQALEMKEMSAAVLLFDKIQHAKDLAIHISNSTGKYSMPIRAQTVDALNGKYEIVHSSYTDEEAKQMISEFNQFAEDLDFLAQNVGTLQDTLNSYGIFMSRVKDGLENYEGRDEPARTYSNVQDVSNSLIIFGKNKTKSDGNWTLMLIHDDAEYQRITSGEQQGINGKHTEIKYHADSNTLTLWVNQPNPAELYSRAAGENTEWASPDIGADGLTASVEGLALRFDHTREDQVNQTHLGYLQESLDVLEARYDANMFQSPD